MKNILILITFLFSINSFSQEVTLLYVNSTWNKSNDYKYLNLLDNVRVLKADYDDQPIKFKNQIKSVPAIILFDKNKKPKRIWQGGLSMKLIVDPKEIQKAINNIYSK
tara:strand:- start:179 stop:502 length:324 start_codon:yes stop_codon:yes gene_type:complete